MATATKSYTGSAGAAYYFVISSNVASLNITGATFNLSSLYPTITAKITKSGLAVGDIDISANYVINSQTGDSVSYTYNDRWSSGATKTLARTVTPQTFNTSTFFTSSNKTVRSLSVNLVGSTNSVYGYCRDEDALWTDTVRQTLGTVSLSQTITLDVPPTFSETFSYTDDFSGVPYANITTANISLADLTAYYGGDFSGAGNAEFIIGSQTVSKANPTNNDILSIPLNAVGTFTPTVKVTDSRGQVTTHTLSAITIKGYFAPSVTFDVDRTTSTGKPDDEGTYATVDATFVFADAIATLQAPSVVLTDEGGTQTTPTVTWYSARAVDGTLSGSVTWSSLSSGDTLYGLIPNVNTQYSYQISIRPRDSQGTGTAITQTLSSAFYTVDFLAGGHGIAFGKPASNTGFECAMTALFEDTIQADGTATFGSDVLIDLPDYTTAGTTDKAIYDAVVSLGWDSDVLVN